MIETLKIEGGIEWFRVTLPDGTIEEDCQCARCGSSCDSIHCWDCGGQGGYMGEDIDRAYDYGWIDEDEWYTCRTCKGTGGSWHCLSGPEWCEANPLPGREHILSTALNAEAWRE